VSKHHVNKRGIYKWSSYCKYIQTKIILSYITFYLSSEVCFNLIFRRSYRTIGLHWSSAILNSMVVLLLGACLSQSGPGWCTILNIPYVLFPLAVAMQCLAETPLHQSQTKGKPSWLDKALVFLLIESSLAALLKGLVSSCHIYCNHSFTTRFANMVLVESIFKLILWFKNKSSLSWN
jgi:hypothetical protein